MARRTPSKSELDRKIELLEEQLRELNRAIRATERGSPAAAGSVTPARQPWRPDPAPPPADPARGNMPVPSAPDRRPDGVAAFEPRNPEDEKRRFANYFTSGPMMSAGCRPLRTQRRQMRNRAIVMIAVVVLLGTVIYNLAGC